MIFPKYPFPCKFTIFALMHSKMCVRVFPIEVKFSNFVYFITYLKKVFGMERLHGNCRSSMNRHFLFLFVNISEES